MNSKFYTKEGLTIKKLINDLIEKNVGDKIKSISDYYQDFGVSRGTVQNSFSYLKDVGAIEVNPRGRLGTFISCIDKKKMFEIYGDNKFIGVMPLPYSSIYEGLATAIFIESQKKDIDLQMAFMRGAESRIEMLLKGNYDFVIMSKLSGDYYLEKNKELKSVTSFGPGTYVKKHIIILNKRYNEIEDGMKFGVDNSSRDMVILTKHECRNKKVQFINLPYMQLLSKVISGEIDGAVINADNIKAAVDNVTIKEIDIQFFNENDTEAVVIAKNDNKIIFELFKNFVDNDSIIKIQDDVINGEMLPIY